MGEGQRGEHREVDMLGWKSAEWALCGESLPSLTIKRRTNVTEVVDHKHRRISYHSSSSREKHSRYQYNFLYISTKIVTAITAYVVPRPAHCSTSEVISCTPSRDGDPTLSIKAKDPKSSAFTYAQSKDEQCAHKLRFHAGVSMML